MIQRYIGDRAFYRRFFRIAIPVIIQNGITNFVSMLDNIMVGQVGSVQMSGVSIVNGLIFVFNLCIFGACSGAGIFTAQYYGSQDNDGIRYTFRFKVIICTLLSALGIGLLLTAGAPLIGLYLTGEGDPAEAAAVGVYGQNYLKIMLLGLLPFALANAYSGTLRETGQASVPMAAGIAAVFVNLIFNYVLIFGHFGAPKLGVNGAAIATVISRYVELAIVAVWSHTHTGKNPFFSGAYRSLAIPKALLGRIITKGMPLLANEALWSIGVAMLSQSYSTCGLDVVPAMNIANTLGNLTSVVFMSCGSSVGILMGQIMGSGCSEEEVRTTNRKLIFTSIALSVIFAVILFILSVYFPMLYNTTDTIRLLATRLCWITAFMMPFNAFLNATYFTLRSGGKTFITFLFDSGFMWVCCIPVAFLLSRLTDISILPLFAVTNCLDLIKCVVGARMLKKGTWIQNLAAK